MIKFPLTAIQPSGAVLAHIKDAEGRIIVGGAMLEDAERLVTAANAGAQIQHAQPLVKQPHRRNKRDRIAEELRDSDPLAVIMERDEIIYGHHDELPQAGESVVRFRR